MSQASLFGDFPMESGPEPERDDSAPRGPIAAVAIEDSLDKLLDYSVGPKLANLIQAGQRVKVPLGRRNRPAFGYVVEVKDHTTFPRVKPILEIDDPRVLVTRGLMELCRFMSRYYCAPLGTVIDNIIPAAVRKRVGLEYLHMVRLARPREEIQAIFEKNRGPKRKAVLARLLQFEPGEAVELHRLAEEAGATAPTVRKMAALGLISIKAEPDMGWADVEAIAQVASHDPALATPPQLNEDQARVYEQVHAQIQAGGFEVNLLMGVTGSGKTEVYLRCIEEVIARGKSAIVLVPEIALTPQTVRRFTARFPRVAVLHSGLSNSQRHRYWQQCFTGQVDVVVGARSGVFAPLPNLGMIVVDEEHEQSYKQDQAPRYHARDIAIVRAQMEKCPVILGSATPSLESYTKAGGAAGNPNLDPPALPPAADARNPYHLLSLPRRVRGLSLPEVELVDMRQDARLRPNKGIHLFSVRLEAVLKATVSAGHQAILLLNRRGYSSFVHCASCQEPLKCDYCDSTMTYHRTVASAAHGGSVEQALHTGQLLCHYCLAVGRLPDRCPTCSKKLSLFGLGTQRVEEEMAKKFPGVTYARVDSDSMHSAKDYEQLLTRFGSGEIQVLLGTQMIAKGLDYPNVTLVGVISADTSLSIPDFRSGERTFQLITQVAGRAGRGDAPGRVVVQTFNPEDTSIRAALTHDYIGFAGNELKMRRQVGLPPYGRMVRIVMRDQDEQRLHKKAQDLAMQIEQSLKQMAQNPQAQREAPVTFKGPMPCAIGRIAGYMRQQILLQSARAGALQRLLLLLREAGHLATNDRIAVDVDPVSLL